MKKNVSGISQLSNGHWSYRFVLYDSDGTRHDVRKSRDESGNVLISKKAALAAKESEYKKLTSTKIKKDINEKNKKITFAEVMNDYLECGTTGKAYGTVRKQTSVWNNHIEAAFGSKVIEDTTTFEINDYLSTLYYSMNYE